MKCPTCAEQETKVIDSRLSSSGVAIRRRRECLKCEFRFSTLEEVQILDLTIIKRNGAREPYSRDKMSRGLKKAFEKRPISRDDFDRLVQIVEQDIQILRKPEVLAEEIGEIVMRRLKRVDEVAFIRFASVYQGFKDAAAFHKAILRLSPSRPRKVVSRLTKRITLPKRSKKTISRRRKK